jgi:hypothetical protein
MPRYNIEYNGSTTIRREFPDSVGDVKAVKVAVYNREGTALLSATSATVAGIGAGPTYAYTGVLTSAVRVGESTCTLNAGAPTLYTGDLVRIGGDTTAQDTLRVESYNSSTRVVTFDDYFRHAHASGEYLKARFCTYALATTVTTTWTPNLDLTFTWTFYSDGAGSTSPYMPYSDEGRVLRRISGEGGLESAFRLRYRQYAEMVQGLDFDTVSSDALNELKDLFASKALDVEKIVDSHAFYELHLCQMAYSLAYGQGSDYAEEREAIKERRLELINILSSMPVWSDNDQDLIEEDQEVQVFDRPYPRRRIF